MNSVQLGGRLCKGGELKMTNANKPYYRGTLAVWDSWKKESQFYDFVIFGKRSELFEDWVKEGRYVIITGSLSINDWTDTSGQKRRSYSTQVKDFEIPRSRDDAKPGDGRPDEADMAAGQGADEDGGDIPF